MAGFWNNFQNHRQLSEHILELRAALGKPEKAGKIFHVSDVIEASRNFILDFPHKKQPKFVKTKSDRSKSTVFIFRAILYQ
jgi:hypothetical protein